jgi:hypothetical protein
MKRVIGDSFTREQTEHMALSETKRKKRLYVGRRAPFSASSRDVANSRFLMF